MVGVALVVLLVLLVLKLLLLVLELLLPVLLLVALVVELVLGRRACDGEPGEPAHCGRDRDGDPFEHGPAAGRRLIGRARIVGAGRAHGVLAAAKYQSADVDHTSASRTSTSPPSTGKTAEGRPRTRSASILTVNAP